jgi:hypothetical protein
MFFFVLANGDGGVELKEAITFQVAAGTLSIAPKLRLQDMTRSH